MKAEPAKVMLKNSNEKKLNLLDLAQCLWLWRQQQKCHSRHQNQSPIVFLCRNYAVETTFRSRLLLCICFPELGIALLLPLSSHVFLLLVSRRPLPPSSLSAVCSFPLIPQEIWFIFCSDDLCFFGM